jgi:hypothetical protein
VGVRLVSIDDAETRAAAMTQVGENDKECINNRCNRSLLDEDKNLHTTVTRKAVIALLNRTHLIVPAPAAIASGGTL